MGSTRIRLVALYCLTTLIFGTTRTDAGVLSDLTAVYGPAEAYAGFTVGAVDSNNDNPETPSTQSPNTLVSKGTLSVTGVGPIDFVIEVTNSGGTTEYFADFGTALNLSGVDWTGYEFSLGIGYGEDFRRLSKYPSYAIPGLDSDFPDKDLPPTTNVFDLKSWEPDRIIFQGGGILRVGESGVASTFSLDIPDYDGAVGDKYEFTIRGQPIVPEPTTRAIWSLFGACGAAVAARRRKRNT